MTFHLPGPVGRLEAELWLPGAVRPVGSEADVYGAHSDEPPPRAAAVMCHPNPAAGGTMRTTALFRAARGLQAAGLAVLRFNFRGVEGSDGEIEAGPREVDDVAAALDWLEQRFPGTPLWAGGFSFGARTSAAHAVRDPRVERIALIALPVTAFPCDVIREVRTPGLVLQAGEDQFGNLADLRRMYPDLDPSLELDEIEGCGHFFEGRTRELQERVTAWATRHLPPAVPAATKP